MENEEKIAAMVIQAQEYAARLEQAQNTIHSLSEPKLLEDDELLSFHSGFHPLSVSSHEGATKETEITKVLFKGSKKLCTKVNCFRDLCFQQNLDKKCKKKSNEI